MANDDKEQYPTARRGPCPRRQHYKALTVTAAAAGLAILSRAPHTTGTAAPPPTTATMDILAPLRNYVDDGLFAPWKLDPTGRNLTEGKDWWSNTHLTSR